MLAHGFRQGEQYKTEFAFFGDATALDRIRDYFLSNGYEQDKAQTDEMLIVVRPVTLTYDSTGKALHNMQNLAREYAVTFDGWSVDARQIH
jgi:regulator of ribonuclease activity B